MITVTTACEEPDSKPAHHWGAVHAALAEAAANNHVCVIGGKRLEQPTKLARIVLSVAVDLDGDLEAVIPCVLVSRLDGGADADVVGKAHDECSGALRLAPRAVRRPVVDDENLEPGVKSTDLLDDAADRRGLVQGGNDRQPTHGYDPLVMGCGSSRRAPSQGSRVYSPLSLDLLSAL